MTSVHAELSSTRLRAESNILFYALDTHQRGWSVIPLLGGVHPTWGKRPPISWAKFQHRQASEQQIETWFSEGYSAYGVVCGRVSNLIVIDFDDEKIQREFIQKFPQLLKTRIVRSGLRGTFHIYLQTDFPISTCKLRGGDLKAEGSYVVGAGSQIAGGTWQVIQDEPLYPISESELSEFLSEFGLAYNVSSIASNLAADAKSPEDFVRIYQFLVHELDSRNEALFRTGCYMRDEGYSLPDVIAVLGAIHANQFGIHQHKNERYTQRMRESERTIQSVFSKPPRPKSRGDSKQIDASYVPNALREALLEEPDGVAFLRVYEGLLLSEKSSGDTITEREILELLSAHGVGRPSVRKALQFSIAPSLRNPPHAVADLAMADSQTKTCVFVQTTLGDKSIGRPARSYIIPDIATLCQMKNIDNIGADPIALEDIQSSATYRAAFNRELIKRRPGKYSQGWLGNRLNVSKRTLQRYLERENVQSRQLLEEIRIHWHNINQIPIAYIAERAGIDIQPYFLQDEQGKRYPPKPEIARKLLKQKHSVWLMRRSVNMYWFPQEEIQPLVQEVSESTSNERIFEKPEYPVVDNLLTQKTLLPIQPDTSVNNTILFPTPSDTPKSKETSPKRSKRFYKKPLPDAKDEWLAQKVYRATDNLQEIEARQLVDTYGRKAVGQALGRMEYLRDKGEIENPAGFMKVVSRVCWRTIHGIGEKAPDYKSPEKRNPRKRLYNPKQDSIWQSETYQQWRLSFEDAPIDIWEIPQQKKLLEL